MQFQQLEAFVEIVRLGSVLKAAERLHLSQPALTLRIKTLERSTGTALLVRSAHGMRLTEAGRSLLPFAERILSLAADGSRTIRDVAQGGVGTLFVGALASATPSLPEIIARFHTTHPNVFLHILTAGQTELREMILQEHVQVGVGRLISDPQIEATPLYEDELVVASKPGSPMASRKRITIKALANERLIRVRRATATRDVVTDLLDDAGISPVERMNVDNAELARRVLEKGVGVAIRPLSTVWDEAKRGTLSFTKLSGTRSDRIRTQMIMAAMRRRGSLTSPLVDAFLRVATTFVPPGAHAVSADHRG